MPQEVVVYSEFLTAKSVVRHDVERSSSCYKFTVNHGFTGLIAFMKRLFHVRSKVSQNKTKQIKCNDIN